MNLFSEFTVLPQHKIPNQPPKTPAQKAIEAGEKLKTETKIRSGEKLPLNARVYSPDGQWKNTDKYTLEPNVKG